MSRIGKKAILIPGNVEVKIEDSRVSIKGPKGQLQREMRPEIGVEIKGKEIFVFPKIKTKRTEAFWGTMRAQIANMIKGVIEGFEKKLEIKGLGYKAVLDTSDSGLNLWVGFSHPIKINPPSGVKISVKKNIITVSGADIELVGQIAAKIRRVKPPEPYKGKGIRYLDEVVRRKVGKKAAATTG